MCGRLEQFEEEGANQNLKKNATFNVFQSRIFVRFDSRAVHLTPFNRCAGCFVFI